MSGLARVRLRHATAVVLLAAALVLSVSVTTSGGSGSSSRAEAQADCRGTTVKAAFFSGGPYSTILASIPQWESSTGAKVEVVFEGSGADYLPRVVQLLASGTSIDVMSDHTSFYQQHLNFLMPLETLFSRAQLSRFYPSLIRASTSGGHLWQIPRHLDVGILYYRTDLFRNAKFKRDFRAKYGYALAPPKTYQQFKDMAIFFSGARRGLYGTSIPGKAVGDALLGRFNELLVSFGGSFLSKNGRAVAFGGRPGRDVLQFLRDLYAAKAIPPSTPSVFFTEQDQLFQNGSVAFHVNFPYAWGIYGDKKQSKVALQFAVADNPAGPKAHVSWGAAHTWAIAKTSSNAACAASLINFLTSTAVMLTEVRQGFLPPRSDVIAQLVAEARGARAKARLKLYERIIQNEFLAVPPTPKWPDLASALAPIIQKVMIGDSAVDSGLKQMVKSGNSVLRKKS